MILTIPIFASYSAFSTSFSDLVLNLFDVYEYDLEKEKILLTTEFLKAL